MIIDGGMDADDPRGEGSLRSRTFKGFFGVISALSPLAFPRIP